MDPADDAAERAFRDLQAEVAALRQAVEATRATAPDYGPTLGTIAKELKDVARCLAAIEAHPALELTPERHARQLASAGTGLLRDAAHRLDRAALAADDERRRLADLIGTARHQDEQRVWLLWTGLAAFVIGLALAPFLAGLLPFGLDGRVAAMVMRADRWRAGSALMAEADPTGWTEIVTAASLARANEPVLRACREAARKTGKEQRCAVAVKAP